MVEPLFALTPIPGEVAAASGLALTGAVAALWKRANVLQDRQQARDDANLMRVMDVVERVIKALDENTAAIQEARRAV